MASESTGASRWPGKCTAGAKAFPRCASPIRARRATARAASSSEHVASEVLALRELLELRVDERGVDPDALLAVPACVERDFLDTPLHHGVQSPRAYVLHLLFDRPGHFP